MSFSPYPLSFAEDAGLRHFLARVYLQVAAGLGLAAAVAGAVTTQPAVQGLFLRVLDGSPVGFTALGLVMVFAPLAILLVAGLTGGGGRIGSALVFWTVCASLGVSLSLLCIGYADESLTSAFLTTSAGFCVMTVWGLTTRRDITGWGGFLTLALAGLMVGWLIEAVFNKTGGSLLLDAAGVIVFALLVAVDGQRLKQIYRLTAEGGEPRSVAVNMAALSLFLSFINLFELMLSLTGRRRR